MIPEVMDHPEDDEAASSGHDNDNDGVESTGSLCAAGEDDIIVNTGSTLRPPIRLLANLCPPNLVYVCT